MAQAAPRRTRRLQAVQTESGAQKRPVLTVVPGVSEESAANEPRVLPIDVVMCCTHDDLPSIGRIFDALYDYGCVPMAMTGAELDPIRLTESALTPGEPRLYVLCKTPRVSGTQARRLVEAFAHASRHQRHQFLVLDLDAQSIVNAVPQIRRGADQLRRRIANARAKQEQPKLPGPDESTAGAQPGEHLLPRKAVVDTSYAMHRGENGGRVDRVVVEVDARPRKRR